LDFTSKLFTTSTDVIMVGIKELAETRSTAISVECGERVTKYIIYSALRNDNFSKLTPPILTDKSG